MKMDYSVTTVCHKGKIPSSPDQRYFLILDGSGVLNAHGISVRMEKDAVISFLPDVEGEVLSDNEEPLVLGVIREYEYDFKTYKLTVYPPQNTSLIREVFFLGMSVRNSTMKNYEAVYTAIHYLMHQVISSAGQSSVPVEMPVIIVIEDIKKHWSEVDYNVNDVIRSTGYSYDHFRKKFREETGISPSEFLSTYRIDRAEAMLRQRKDNISIKEIAQQCGFSDPYYFSRVFKAKMGVSPQKYAQEYAQESAQANTE